MRLRTILVWLLAVGMVGWAGGCRKKPQYDLVLLSPHTQAVQDEFTRAYQAWHQQKYGTTPRLEWRDVGGGGAEIAKFLKAQYSRSNTSGVDIYFGGGAPNHEDLAASGLLTKIQLPKELLDALPQELGGIREYDAQAGWYGACLSTWGIIYNDKLIQEKGLPAPAKWEDLADPKMFDQTAAADPSSSSALACYELILQTAPDWPAGWRRLLAFWANCQSYVPGSSRVPGMVSDGQVLAGTSIDYYAFTQMEAKRGLLKFVVPQGGAVVTPDPISVLKGAPHAEQAQRFVEFVLSTEGQGLWGLKPGVVGGPTKTSLFRLPIRKDLYEQRKGDLLEVLVNPFGLEGYFKLDAKLQAARVPHILPGLMRAAAIDNKDALHKAWKKILDQGQPKELMDEFAALPPDLATVESLLATAEKIASATRSGDAKAVDQISSAWQGFFRQKYQRILENRQP